MKNCLFKLGRRTVRVSACAFMAVAVCTNKSWAAADVVPDEWNTAPMTNGAHLVSFETLPAWANATGSSTVTNDFPTTGISTLPVRVNDWFGTSLKVLKLSTDGTALTNELEGSDNGDIDFATAPVYIDMRVLFTPMAEDLDVELLTNRRLVLIVNSDTKLVAYHDGGATTNTVAFTADTWYQITAVLYNNTCDVKVNDLAVFTNLAIPSSAPDNKLVDVGFEGTGYVDELYVSRGAPDYAVLGPTNGIAATLPTGGSEPTDVEQTKINKWLSDQSGLTALSMTQDELGEAYLVDATISGDAGSVVIDFGISAIDLITVTNLRITVKLTLDGTAKSEPINGRIQLKGTTTKDGSWDVLGSAITPVGIDFDANGEAVYDYTIPAGGYKFFKSTIIP